VTDFVVFLAPGAESDIAEAFAWYRERNALVADAFRAEVFDTIDRIATTALNRAADDDGIRKRLLHRFPYTVHYEVVKNMVTVLAVAHQRRQPGYWRARQA
jgi:plasmid stabilization system protein ParE